LLLGDLFQWDKLVKPGVIDHDVDLAKCFLCVGEQFLDVCLLRDVPRDGDSFSTGLTNFVHHAICALF
jgi:hypothetical protein